MEGKVLIADDEKYIRLLIEQTLEGLIDEGVEVLTADNGADALRLIQVERPDLVFLDVMMPAMNGFDVCHAVKRQLGMAGIYIALVTAKGQEFDRRHGEDAGADSYITKPFDPDALIALANGVLARRAASK